MGLIFVPPEMLATVWPLLAAGVAKVWRHSTKEWTAADLIVALRDGSAWLYVGFEPISFIVFRPEEVPAGLNLHIWMAYGSHAQLGEVEQIARDCGAKSLTFKSPRRGWWRWGRGFEPVETKWRKTL